MSELTVRERILRQIKAELENMGTDYPFEWSYVTRADLDTREYGKARTIAILDTAETKTPRIGHTEASLTVILQWTGTLDRGDDPSAKANEVLGAVYRRLRENWTLVEDGTGIQLALDLNEQSNTLDIADARDRMIGGTNTIQVVYRHSRDDPRVLGSSFTR